MANLNFQQPPRSIANSSLNNRSGGNVGGSFVNTGVNPLSGHVTPTSGMFQPNSAAFGSQLSPNRSGGVQLSGVFNQTLGIGSGGSANQQNRSNLLRTITDRRMQNIAPMVSKIEVHIYIGC